jgi:tRNA(fMet)-specific endonuclease VapC
MRYLLDTNIVSALMKDPAGPVAERIRIVGEGAICTSVIVMAEIKYGIGKLGSRRLARQFERIAASLPVEPFAEPADERYATVRYETESRGVTVSQNDLLIAAQTLALEAVLVSDDRIFLAVPGLKVENWLRQ